MVASPNGKGDFVSHATGATVESMVLRPFDENIASVFGGNPDSALFNLSNLTTQMALGYLAKPTYMKGVPRSTLQRRGVQTDFVQVLRERILSWDPDPKDFRPHEAVLALELEKVLGRQLWRSPKGRGDYSDYYGTTFDFVGPVPQGRFNAQAFNSQILKHLRKVSRPVVDMRGLGMWESAQVNAFINKLPAADQARLIILAD